MPEPRAPLLSLVRMEQTQDLCVTSKDEKKPKLLGDLALDSN